jgi:hypothetical protein
MPSTFTGGYVVASQWFLAREGKQYGPYPEEEMERMCQSGRVAGSDLTWCDGMPNWKPASESFPLHVPRPAPPPRSIRRRDDDSFEFNDHDQEVLQRRRQRRPAAEFPGRLISPSSFILVLLLFPLPWVELSCHGPMGSLTVASQSGLQACWGGYSVINVNDQGFGRRPVNPPAANVANPKVASAPLMVIFILLVLLGLIFGLALPIGWFRFSMVAGCSGLAILLLLIQIGTGFPFAKSAREVQDQQRMQQNNVRLGQPQFGNAPLPPLQAGQRLEVHTTPWLWLALLFLFLPIGLLFVENYGVFPDRYRSRRLALEDG